MLHQGWSEPRIFWEQVPSVLITPKQVGWSLLFDPCHRSPLELSEVEGVGLSTALLLLLQLQFCLSELFGGQLSENVSWVIMVVSRSIFPDGAARLAEPPSGERRRCCRSFHCHFSGPDSSGNVPCHHFEIINRHPGLTGARITQSERYIHNKHVPQCLHQQCMLRVTTE